MSDHFNYRDGVLCAEDVSLQQISNEFGTPCYIYSTATLVRQFNVFCQALEKQHLRFKVHYALKANSNQAIINIFANLGAGGDVVSKGEVMRCIKAGIKAGDIVFSGVGKTAEELEFALGHGVLQFNIESPSELFLLANIAKKLQKPADIAIRVNPDVDAKTHAKISTGLKENKFGIPLSDAYALYKQVDTLPFINSVGIACHIGSQLTTLPPYKAAFERINQLAEDLLKDNIPIQRIDLGGGAWRALS